MPVFLQGIIFVVGFILVIFVLPLYLLNRNLKKKNKKMQHIALSMGLSYNEKGDGALIKDFSMLPLFQKGDTRHEENILRKDSINHGSISIFNYNYVEHADRATGSGIKKYSSAHVQTVVCFKSGKLNLPEFVCQPERLLDKMVGKTLLANFGYQDINLDSYPEFSKKYLLYGKDKHAIGNLFSGSEVINFCEREKDIYIEGIGDKLVVYRHMKIVSPQEIHSFLEKAKQVYSILSQR